MNSIQSWFNAAAAAFGIAGLLFILFLAALWIIFPFVVWHGLSRIARGQSRQTALLEQIARQTAPAGPTAAKESSVRYTISGING